MPLHAPAIKKDLTTAIGDAPPPDYHYPGAAVSGSCADRRLADFGAILVDRSGSSGGGGTSPISVMSATQEAPFMGN